MSINIEELTVSQVREISGMFGGGTQPLSQSAPQQGLPFKVGYKYLFRTVTHIDVGEVVSVCGDFVELKNASWIADTGRYHDCLAKGEFSEVEPYVDNVFVNAAALVDCGVWNHNLPTEQK